MSFGLRPSAAADAHSEAAARHERRSSSWKNKGNSCCGQANHIEMFIGAANANIHSMCLMMFRLPPHHSLNIILHNLWGSEEKNMKPPQEAAGGWWQPGSEWLCRASRSSTCDFSDFTHTWVFSLQIITNRCLQVWHNRPANVHVLLERPMTDRTQFGSPSLILATWFHQKKHHNKHNNEILFYKLLLISSV